MKILPQLASCRATVAVFLGAALLAVGFPTQAQAPKTNAPAAEDADKLWKEVEQATRPPVPPPEWQGRRPTPEQIEKFRSEQSVLLGAAADKVKDFYTRFPNHPKAGEARQKELEVLQFAVYLGNTNKLATLEAREQERLKDPKLSEDEKFEIRAQAVQRGVMQKQEQGEAAMLAAQDKGARELLKDFPKREEVYQMLLEVAAESESDKARGIAKEVLAASVSEPLKTTAQGLLNKLDALGKPLDIKFTSVDGREVDLKKMEGKVVLVDFWATWCGPCVAELPNVKAAYDKLHPKGLEIVGISFDADKGRLEKFVADQKMGWPQYFDGKRWENKIGQQYGINSIPAMWLVDKKGNLRDMNARGGLEEKVEKLLAE